jgi:hypothetical protein
MCLEYRNTKLAVIEAKAWDKPLTEGVAQAKDYAGKLAVRFTYATNGQSIYGIDMQTGAESELIQYPTPLELWNRTFATSNFMAGSIFSLCPSRTGAAIFRDVIIRTLPLIGLCRPLPTVKTDSADTGNRNRKNIHCFQIAHGSCFIADGT